MKTEFVVFGVGVMWHGAQALFGVAAACTYAGDWVLRKQAAILKEAFTTIDSAYRHPSTIPVSKETEADWQDFKHNTLAADLSVGERTH